MELVPVPDFKSGGSWPWSGMVSSILMLSRQLFLFLRMFSLIDDKRTIPKDSVACQQSFHKGKLELYNNIGDYRILIQK